MLHPSQLASPWNCHDQRSQGSFYIHSGRPWLRSMAFSSSHTRPLLSPLIYKYKHGAAERFWSPFALHVSTFLFSSIQHYVTIARSLRAECWNKKLRPVRAVLCCFAASCLPWTDAVAAVTVRFSPSSLDQVQFLLIDQSCSLFFSPLWRHGAMKSCRFHMKLSSSLSRSSSSSLTVAPNAGHQQGKNHLSSYS